MGLFSRAPKAPATVAEALSAIAILKDSLAGVIAASRQKVDYARERIVDAEAYAARVKAEATAEADAAEAEIAKAQRADAALAALLGGPDQETLRREQASADL